MKSKTTLSPFVAIILLIALSIIGCKGKTTEHKSATVEELGQMNRDFAKALVAKDAAAAANLYAKDASLLPPNEPIVNGRANIQKYWQAGIDAGIVGASVHTIDARSDGDLGYEIGTFELKFKDSTGNISVEKGKYTELLKRDSSGKWMSIYGMWNSDSAAEK
jgi:ketosteroid isomerase-like protein